MSEVKNPGTSKTLRLVIVAAIALGIGGGLYYYLSDRTSADATSQVGRPGAKMPSAANSENTSGRGSLKSTGDNTQQSLSGKTMNGPQQTAFGRVVDGDGNGIPDVRVQCTTCQTSAALALTDEKGEFKLPYHFEPHGDIDKMVILVSKAKKSSKHIVQPSNTNGLKLELK